MLRLLRSVRIEHRLLGVILIALSFLVLELVVGFLTRSLALVADAFHILSDVIGYVVALLAAKYGAGRRKAADRYTYGYRRAETLGGFFNGSFLMALGVSILLQSIERFVEPTELTNPVLVMSVGAAGVGSNILMLLVLGGHAHGHSHGSQPDPVAHDHNQDRAGHSHPVDGHASVPASRDHHQHAGHAHTRVQAKPPRFHNVNILGVLIHIMGDALNSIAVIISAGVYMATGFVYADPIASFFVGCMIIATAWPLVVKSGRSLLVAAPDTIDVKGVKEDIERLTGKGTVHDLHVWSIDSKTSIASMHLRHNDDSLASFDAVSERIRECLHLWGIHLSTLQPEPMDAVPPADQTAGEAVYPPQPSAEDAHVDPAVQVAAAVVEPVSGSRSRSRVRGGAQCERQCAGACPDSILLL